ncbi:MAG TPA: glycosyltransferase family 87 protein [Anaerolineales bacterium]|nr:glycosyltransferase family 87 protein [Anaerolineales bacterium]
MKRNLLFLLSLLLLAIIVLIALYVPNSLPANSDFSALYNTDLALVNHIPIYDIPKVEAFAAQHSGIAPEKFFLARFPYPPWYALSTFYLGLLPAKVAATLWFELNLVMLFLSIWLLTDGWPGRLRLIAFPLALFFLPVLGALSVGQYDFPVLLGISLLIYSLRRENIALTTLGVVLLIFKPHVGALVLLSVLIYLIGSRNSFGRRVIRSSLLAAVFLSIVGFAADPAWIISYPKMLLNYQNEGNVTTCSECASLPVWLSRWLFDGSLTTAAIIAVVLLVILAAVFLVIRYALLKSPALLLTSSLSITLLVSPYLYNYDFLLLLVPFAVLIKEGHLIEKMIVIICYLIPTLALLLFERAGNISLILVSIVIAVLLYLNVKNSVIDVPAHAAYNTNINN